MTLFRQQAYQRQLTSIWGNVRLEQPLPLKLVVYSLIASIGFCLIYIGQFQYQKKQSVVGRLIPNTGVIKHYSNEPWLVSSVFVKEGQVVEQGQPLVTLINNRTLANQQQVSQQLLQQAQASLASLKKQRLLLNTQHQQQIKKLNNDITQLIQNKQIIEEQLSNGELLYIIQKQQTASVQQLHHQQLVSQTQLRQSEKELQQAHHQFLLVQEKLQSVGMQVAQLQTQLTHAPQQLQLKFTQLEQQISQQQSQIIQLASQQKLVLTAQQSGIVTSINTYVGQQSKRGQYMLTIVPKHSQITAELYIPSSAIALTKAGQAINLKLASLPFQKFGIVKAHLTQVFKHPITTQELDMPLPLNEPSYRAIATISHNDAHSRIKQQHLQSGMLLTADLLLDTRTIAQWLFEPLLSLSI